ncbi:MAG: Rv0361 family membrane protein, partial [Candidatus Geothermincolia bacterium]
PGMPPAAPGGMPVPPLPRKQKKGMSRGLKVGLIIALCLIVLIIAGIIVGVFAFVKVISAPADVANNYVKAVDAGNLTDAYSALSKKTQDSETLEGFEKKLAPFKGTITKYNTSSINVQTGGTATVVMQLEFNDGTKATWDMGLVKENGTWKIQAVSPR